MLPEIQQSILGFITQHPIFRERIERGGSTLFDDQLIRHLMQCRDQRGIACRGISYYEKIRTDLPIDIYEDCISIDHPDMEITIQTRPYIGGAVRFRDDHHRFRESDDNDFYAYVMDHYDCPIDLDDGYCKNNIVYLRWDHNHFMDMHYSIGYFVPQKRHEDFLWEYTLSGPAQVFCEAMTIANHFHVIVP